jgi:hypothetical protein
MNSEKLPIYTDLISDEDRNGAVKRTIEGVV